MRFHLRSRSRSVCGCEIGDGPDPSARTDETAWTVREESGPVSEPGCEHCQPHNHEDHEHVALSAAPVGSRGRIASVSTPGAPALAHRLHDLGFVKGAMVEVVRRAPLGDPVLYRVCHYEICLRKAQAAAIQMKVLPPEYSAAAATVAETVLSGAAEPATVSVPAI